MIVISSNMYMGIKSTHYTEWPLYSGLLLVLYFLLYILLGYLRNNTVQTTTRNVILIDFSLDDYMLLFIMSIYYFAVE